MSTSLKKIVHEKSLEIMKGKINAIEEAIQNAQEAANEETKSTAGDKHDTSRAMMQLEVEQKSKQLSEAKKSYSFLNNIDPTKKQSVVQIGTFVKTNKGQFYITIGLGNITVNQESIFCISAASPIAQKMLQLKQGDTFDFNGNTHEILQVC